MQEKGVNNMKKFRILGTDKYGPDREILAEFTLGPDMDIADEYHTMHELYQHRMALNVALFNLIARWDKAVGIKTVMKSRQHYDGTMFEGGYFVVMYLPEQISYHYKMKHWDKFRIPEVDRIPAPYDSHTSGDVIERLLSI